MKKKKTIIKPITGFIIDGRTALDLGRNKSLKKYRKDVLYISWDSKRRQSMIAYDKDSKEFEKKLKKYLNF